MEKIYFRVSYKGIGIYEALKYYIWQSSFNPKQEWDNLRKSDAFIWLKTPDCQYKNCCSFFTELGYLLFMEKTFPVFVRYFGDENIEIDKFVFDDENIKVLYYDEHQIVIDKCGL